ncbi:MAG: 2'-5' RNA ligase family protein [Eubacterium sp.]|nr:2'-5' RNA ligase family protein [Eubacterium sp.]
MGHTIVAVFSEDDKSTIETICRNAGIATPNKIPLGKKCDRKAADQVLPYHITMVHWAKEDDAVCLKNAEEFRFSKDVGNHSVSVTGCGLSTDGTFVYLQVKPAPDIAALREELLKEVGGKPSGFWHISLAFDKDREKMERFYQSIKENVTFPFSLKIDALEMYHIWKPTKFVSRYKI